MIETKLGRNKCRKSGYNADAAKQFKHVIYTYQDGQKEIRSQLQTMCDAGQKKISLVVWFTNAPWMNEPTWNNAYGAITNSEDGRLKDPIADNLKKLLVDIRRSKDKTGTGCFNEMFFRFAPWGPSSSFSWGTVWDESMYNQNKSFIFSTRAIVEDVMAGSMVKRTYDIGAEEGGRPNEGQAETYLTRLWADYSREFGTEDSYGFSVAVLNDRGWRLLQSFDKVGIRPKEYALDVYSITNFEQVLNELKIHGESKKPLVIQETFYNDAEFVSAIFSSAKKFGFAIRTIMQWPLQQGATVEYTETFAKDYMNNLPLPQIGRAGIGCTDKKCVWVEGNNFSDSCSISLYSESWSPLGKPLDVSCKNDTASFRVPEGIYQSNSSLRVSVTNTFGKWNSPFFVRIK